MYTDDLLKEKYKAQIEISRENNYDLKKMAEQASLKVKELAKNFNINIKYAEM